MSYNVLIEPADDQRAAFARWCLAQTPKIQTATASGSVVSAELFKQVPEPILVGAYVDGRLYRHVAEQREPVQSEPVPGEPQEGATRTRRRGQKS